MIAPQVLILMGVSGSGKTTIAEALAARLHWPFLEGDSVHPPANVEKMRAGHPLDDSDRRPWLQAIAAWINARRKADEAGIVTCSALKRSYRAILTGGQPGVRIVYLQVDRAVLQARVAARHHQYMPASLLDSQLATLEEPGPDEHPLVVNVAGGMEETVAAILAGLAAAETA